MSYFLGLEIKQGEKDNFVTQKAYAKEILKRFKMEDCKPVSTLIDCGMKLSRHDKENVVDVTLYKSLVGSLRYLTCIIPDILYVVGLVSRYMEPSSTHWKIIKQILRYIRGTLTLGLFYSSSTNNFVIFCYSDSDWGGNTDDRKSTSEFTFYMGDTTFT
jgi:hypothetical protein